MGGCQNASLQYKGATPSACLAILTNKPLSLPLSPFYIFWLFSFFQISFSFDLSQMDICKNRMFMNNCAMANSNQSIRSYG